MRATIRSMMLGMPLMKRIICSLSASLSNYACTYVLWLLGQEPAINPDPVTLDNLSPPIPLLVLFGPELVPCSLLLVRLLQCVAGFVEGRKHSVPERSQQRVRMAYSRFRNHPEIGSQDFRSCQRVSMIVSHFPAKRLELFT